MMLQELSKLTGRKLTHYSPESTSFGERISVLTAEWEMDPVVPATQLFDSIPILPPTTCEHKTKREHRQEGKTRGEKIPNITPPGNYLY